VRRQCAELASKPRIRGAQSADVEDEDEGEGDDGDEDDDDDDDGDGDDGHDKEHDHDGHDHGHDDHDHNHDHDENDWDDHDHGNDHDHDRVHNHDARSGNRGAAHNKREHGVRKLWKSVIGKRLRNQCWKTGLWTRSVVGKRHQIWGRKAAPNMGRIMVPGSLG
jgi:hypothetical protein